MMAADDTPTYGELTRELTSAIAARLPAEAEVSARCVSKAWRVAVDEVASLRDGEARRSQPPNRGPHGLRDGAGLARAWAAAGHLDLLKWGATQLLMAVSERGRGGLAADEANAVVRRWLVRGNIVNAAACGGRVEVLSWLRANGCPWDEVACRGAAGGGHLEVLQCMRADGCPLREATCTAAAKGGHLEVLQWLRANGCPWNEGTCARAAQGGQLEALQWLRANGCPWDEWTCTFAIAGGHLEVLTWLRANGCPWDESSCRQAAQGGHLEVLQWLRVDGCPWDEDTCTYAAVGGHLEVLKWLRANGCPWNKNACRCRAAYHRKGRVRQWIDDNP